MKLFHTLMGGAEFRALRFFDDKSLHLLIAASMLTFEGRWKKHIGMIQEKKKLLFADSGLLGWIKKSGPEAIKEYSLHPERVLEIQQQISPDIIAHADIPMEIGILRMAEISKEKALEITWQNAEFLKEQKMDAIKCFVIQGYEQEDYERSIDYFRQHGFFELDPAKTWFGIGSVCMRTPKTGLYSITKFVMEQVPEQYHIHTFGIANPVWVLELNNIGINSCDSATASFAAAMFQVIDVEGRRVRLSIPSKNKYMFASLAAFNMSSLEHQILTGILPKMENLFEEVLS